MLYLIKSIFMVFFKEMTSMSISIAEAMSEFIRNNDSMCVFITDPYDGSFEITRTGIFSHILSDGLDPITQLRDSENIHPGDKTVVSAVCSDILMCKKESLPDERFYVDFRGNFSDDPDVPDYKWLKLTVLAPKKEDGGVKYIIGHITVMNNSEILTRIILNSFTNDKHPEVFNNRAKQILDESGDRRVAFIQFDIEKFKLINTTYGEDMGTEILNFIGNGLKTICNDSQVCIRLSADVFMVCTAFDSTEEIERLINIIQDRLGHYKDIHYKLVFGVNLVTDKSLPIRKMGDRAAMARQGMKGNALENVAYYADGQENSMISRKFIEDSMDEALANGEFVMYLQPKYSISSESIVGAEALVRWIHPERGIIAPMEFIPIFETNGFITKLDKCIWEQACKTIRNWIDKDIKPVPISINISRVHLTNEKFIGVLNELIEKYDISKDLLEIEITESMENGSADDMIKKLHDSGYVLLMDDFGSGYSSLNTLKNTPFDVIKMDRQFFSEFMLSDRGKKIISHTISMSLDIGMGLVAEGIETKEQAEFLSDCGCDVAQGYYYSRPITLSDFDKLVQEQKNK